MREEYFIDNLSEETIIRMVDKALRFQKNKKQDNKVAHLLKMIPAVACMALIILAINILPMFRHEIDDGEISGPNANTEVRTSEVALFVPKLVEKSFFENSVLAAIKDKRIRNIMNAYYYYQADKGYYALDTSIGAREKNMLLEYYEQYTKLTGDDLIAMYKENGIGYDPENPSRLILQRDPNDPYSHVRFGATRDTLLLDVEWYTPETYEDEFINHYKEQDWYARLSDEAKIQYSATRDEYREHYEKILNQIKEKTTYISRTINGKSGTYVSVGNGEEEIDISEYCDLDGYYIFKIYPYNPSVFYIDENGEEQYKDFGKWTSTLYYSTFTYTYNINNQTEYREVLKNEIIPFCDDLFERGLLTQYSYDYYTTFDPLEFYIDLWFN